MKFLEIVEVDVRAKFHQDRECLWNGSSNRQAENDVMNYDFSPFGRNNSVNFGPHTKKRP